LIYVAAILAVMSCAAWVYLVFFHGGFWRSTLSANELPNPDLPEWPDVLVVIPARNEADVISRTVLSLQQQDYSRPVSIVLVDDNSNDGTAAIARAAAEEAGHADRLAVVDGAPLAPGWTGKVWAMAQGVAHADSIAPQARYILFSDADIEHAPSNLRRLVHTAETEGKDLVSIMVMLMTKGFWERFLIPPFVFFFQMLYPFSRVNDDTRDTAAAAGGCMLVRRSALHRSGGMDAIKGALIDDCALARSLADAGGRLSLSLDAKTRSTRPYGGFSGIWNMVARSAYTQLRYSPWLLMGCIMGMALVYGVPLLVVLAFGWLAPITVLAGLATYILMCVAYIPTLRLYDRPLYTAVFMPLAGMLYTAMTISSAVRHWRGVGGGWKGRVYQQ